MMIDEIRAELERLYPQLIADYKSLIQIPSKKAKAEPNAPYGPACKQVLDKALELCEREGLSTGNADYHMVYGQYGVGEDYVGMFCHLDVVEEGVGWQYPPYAAQIVDNRMYGRGALDSKGPSMAAFYALLILKNLGVVPKRPIRIIFGADEESGMSDIEYYLEHVKAPVMGFVPDNKFPAIYGERGRAIVEITGPADVFTEFYNKYLLNLEGTGKSLGVSCKDEHFGQMVVRGVRLVNTAEGIGARFSLSTPVCDIDALIEQLKQTAKKLNVKLVHFDKWALKNPLSTNAIVLQAAYDEVMQTKTKMTTTTGMTYAHKCETVIPFGPSFPGQNGIAHLPNEWFDLADLKKCIEIYAYALYKLNEVETIVP